MNLPRELSKCLILISLAIAGCSTVPKEETGSILMEDVIVERTTVRSTTQNPKPKTAGGVHISGDNINIGTLIVNSPNAYVDKSIKVAQANQTSSSQSRPAQQEPSQATQSENTVYDIDKELFNNFKKAMPFIIPNLVMFGFR